MALQCSARRQAHLIERVPATWRAARLTKDTQQQADQIRGDLYGIADQLKTVEMMLARLPDRAYLSRTVFMATASVWLLLGVVVLLLLR